MMRAFLALIALVTLSVGSLAGEIRNGATMQVKANSIWFEDLDKLTHWQELRKSGDAAALASYQEDALHQREAWQFIYPLKVRILGHKSNHVYVEMKVPGRLEGTEWFLDASALVR
jgi:hypothetical protein